MAAVPGRPDFAGATDEERRVVADEYLQALARLHQLPTGPFKTAGVISGVSASDCAAVGARRFERHYRSSKVRPDPLMEFVLGWLRRHPLPPADREAPVVWDSGQFHHENGHLVAMVDLELGHIGDPMMDLAGFRMRDTVLGFGNMNALYDRYEAHGGQPVDIDAIQYHHFFFTLTNELSFSGALAAPVAETDYMTYMQWCSETNLFALEALAEILGIDDLATVDMPTPRGSPVANAHEHLVRSLRTIEVPGEYERHQLRIAFRLARHLQRYDEIGDDLTAADLEDLRPLLGHRPDTWQEGDAALEQYVLADGGAHDVELLQLFHRRFLRYKMLTGPAGSAMATHHPIQRFDA
jgi:hypothetical protein